MSLPMCYTIFLQVKWAILIGKIVLGKLNNVSSNTWLVSKMGNTW